MSTTNHLPTRPRLRVPAIAAGGVTVGLAAAVALMRHEADQLPVSLICATAAAFAVALVLLILMGGDQTTDHPGPADPLADVLADDPHQLAGVSPRAIAPAQAITRTDVVHWDRDGGHR